MTAEKKRSSADVQKELEAATRTANKLKATSITLAQRLDAAAAKGAPVKKISAMRKSITDTDKNVKWALKRVEAVTRELAGLRKEEEAAERTRRWEARCAEEEAEEKARRARGDILDGREGWITKEQQLERAGAGQVWCSNLHQWLHSYQEAAEYLKNNQGNEQHVQH